MADAQAGFGGRRGPPREDLVVRFDTDGSGKLNDQERQAARKYIREVRSSRDISDPTAMRSQAQSDLWGDLLASEANAPAGRPDLYDAGTLRTLYLRFPNSDWFGELEDFYRTDVELPADLIVDGKVFRSVGVHFRGNSSYFTIRSSQKKSFGISIDYGDGEQRLYGYRTLNLLNAHTDPSFVREVLFSHISGNYIPALKANYVKLVINGENWGVYVNAQQLNNDFSREWFGTVQGARWKVLPGRGRSGGLFFLGSERAAYEGSFELKTADAPKAWQNLIDLCAVLTTTPDEHLEDRLKSIFDIDAAIWFLALENVFIDSDSYLSRGADYSLYQDPRGRFHMIAHDNNETFRYVGGGGPNTWPRDDPML